MKLEVTCPENSNNGFMLVPEWFRKSVNINQANIFPDLFRAVGNLSVVFQR